MNWLRSLLNKGSVYLLTVAYLIYTYFVGGAHFAYPSFCPFKWIAGVDCIFCGTTRAWGALWHGKIAVAFAYNLWTPLLLPLAVVLVIDRTMQYLTQFKHAQTLR